MKDIRVERESAIHLRRKGHTMKEIASELGRSEPWVRKWWRAYQLKGWAGLEGGSQAPHQHGRRLPEQVRQAVLEARSELEAEAARGQGLKYIGGRAVRTRLKAKKLNSLPSLATIERILQQAGMTKPKAKAPEIVYPRLRPMQPHQLSQVDHMPHFLQGGQRVFCFNGIDVVSRYPTGQVYPQRRASEAVDFLIHLWQTLGLSRYTQVDNEACFSGGFTHPYVLGQCVRLALKVGIELLFSPVRHPQSNSSVERFHQDYQSHVWQDTYLADCQAVQAQADHFFDLYRQSEHHSALQGQTPQFLHDNPPPLRLAADFVRPTEKLPLYAGRVHFIRRVQADGTVSVLNVPWAVPHFDPLKGVWVTLELRVKASILLIYDAAPDVPDRKCLVTYPFPVKEPVLPQPGLTEPQISASDPATPGTLAFSTSSRLSQKLVNIGSGLLLTMFRHSSQLVRHLVDTIY